MSSDSFRRTEVAGVSMPRMIVGTNWFSGFSHRSIAADNMIRSHLDTPEKIAEILEVFLEKDINAIMGLLFAQPNVSKAINITEQHTGKKIIVIDTPVINVDDTPEARKEAEATIKMCKQKDDATFCLIHHSSCEALVNKNKRTIERIPDYLYMIRENGMIPGLSAHMPDIIQFSDENNYDVQTYIQIYNAVGFLMQIEIELVNKIIWNAKKPVMTIKPFAAGRTTPFVGLNFSFATLRDCDMVAVGVMSPMEAEEDIEIASAFFENRQVKVKARGSIAKTPLHRDN